MQMNNEIYVVGIRYTTLLWMFLVCTSLNDDFAS